MRPIRIVAVLVGCLSLALPAFAQTGPSLRTIMVPSVEVRSGPGDTEALYPTSKLKQGDEVVVVRQNDKAPTWLEIQPPPGSFSWINERFIGSREGKHTAIVAADQGEGAPIFAGSAIHNKKPEVATGFLKPGSIVILVGEPFRVDGQSWLPIEPSPNEVRFLPEAAVQGSPVLPPYNHGPSVTAMIQQADQYGKSPQARNLYLLAAQKSSDYEQRVHCHRKLNEIDGKNSSPVASAQPGNPNPAILTAQAQPVQAKLANIQTVTTNSAQLQTAATGVPKGFTVGAVQWAPTWGTLKKSNHTYNGQTMYVLLDQKGQPITYAISPPNQTLETYAGRLVSLWGTVGYRSDAYLRAHYMVVTYVALPPAGKAG